MNVKIIVNVLIVVLISIVNAQDVVIPWKGKTINDLRQEYYNIFPNRNRNAASHRWATFILERAGNMEKATFEHMFSGFCPVSGSPIGQPGPRTLWRMTLPHAHDWTPITGGIHFC